MGAIKPPRLKAAITSPTWQALLKRFNARSGTKIGNIPPMVQPNMA
jgi:hypothetical protein